MYNVITKGCKKIRNLLKCNVGSNLNKQKIRGVIMLRVVETFSGIGAQVKALKKAKINHEILATADWDINAIIAYDLIHNGSQNLEKYINYTKEELLDQVSQLSLSLDGKERAPFSSICKLSSETLTRLICAIHNTNNLISVTDIKGEDLPNEMNTLTYSFPCQDLSVAGFWHGNKGGIDKDANNRSSMLWQIGRILNERDQQKLPMPRYLLMENVRSINSKDIEKILNNGKKN